jgi:hypothetical protein
MRIRINQTLLGVVVVVFLPFNIAASGKNLKELELRCEQAREEKIAPLRKAAIEDCVAKDRSPKDAREKCEKFYVDYGAGVRYKSGGHKERMFNDLPECLEFYETEKASKKDSKR